MSEENGVRYRVVRSIYFTPADFALARRYSRLEDALAVMGDGLVIADDWHVAAFHERHEAAMTRGVTFGLRRHPPRREARE